MKMQKIGLQLFTVRNHFGSSALYFGSKPALGVGYANCIRYAVFELPVSYIDGRYRFWLYKELLV